MAQPLKEKIIQIVSPTVPSWAVYKDEEGKESTDAIHLWALLEDETGERYVKGITSADIHGGGYADDVQNFVRYQDTAIPNPTTPLSASAYLGVRPR